MPKHIWLLVIGIAINVTGSSFIWPLNTIYIHNELGQTLAFAGVVLMLNQGAGIFGNLLGGVLYDRLGGYITITYGNIISIAASVALIFYHSILSYTILMIVLGLGSGVARPAMFAMASSVWPEGGRRAFNALYVAQNLGVAIGASLGGFVAKFSFEYIFIANALFFFVFFLLAVLTYKPIDSKYDPHSYGTVLDQNLKIVKKANFRALIMLSIGFFICWVAYVQWQTTIASYTQDIGISIDRYSLLWTINGLLIVLG
ncbi:MFS transporter [Bacillaceae bacterium S4-13-56]